jgi:hypothetical protein
VMNKRKFVHNAKRQGAEGFFRCSGFHPEENSSPLLPKEQLAPLAIRVAVIAAADF